MTYKKDYPDELTAEMHSEFTVSKETRIMLKAGCVWESVSPKASKEEIETFASLYGITYADAMKHNSEWVIDNHNSEDRYDK